MAKKINKKATTKKKATKKTVKKATKKTVAKVDKLEANAAAIHSVVSGRTASSLLTDISDYSDPNLDDRTALIALTRKLRRVEGICSSVADLLADFAITRGSFYSDNPDLKSLLNKWANTVNSNMSPKRKAVAGVIFPVPGLRALSRKVFDDYITDGDSIFSLFWEKGVAVDGVDNSVFIPTSIKVLDTTTLSIDPDLAKIGVERVVLELDTKLKKRIITPVTDADKFLAKSVPKEWVKKLKSGKDIVLNSDVTYHVKRNSKDYLPWGESMFVKAFGAVAVKRRLLAVDEATIDGLINRFTVFKVGLEDKVKNPAYHIPSGARVEALISILTNPKRTNAIVWPGPDLDIIDIGPDGKVLEFHEKYKQADIDILRALHTSPVLIDGGTGVNITSDWISFVSTEVGLDVIRDELERIFTLIGKDIAIANSMEYESISYKFDGQLLKNEQRVRNFALRVFELGGLSKETFVDTMGYDFDIEKRLKENEKKDGTDELFVNPNVPGFTNLQDVKNDGRPEGPDKEVPDKEVPDKEEANLVAAAATNIEMFRRLYHTEFDTITEEAQRRESVSDINMALVSGFSGFKRLVEIQIGESYRKYAKTMVPADLSFLLKWNDAYIDNFLEDLIVSSDENELVEKIKKSKQRINQYAEESFAKAKWVGKISNARNSGSTRAIWKQRENSNCEKAKERNNRVYELDTLVREFPGHPSCNCSLDFI